MIPLQLKSHSWQDCTGTAVSNMSNASETTVQHAVFLFIPSGVAVQTWASLGLICTFHHFHFPFTRILSRVQYMPWMAAKYCMSWEMAYSLTSFWGLDLWRFASATCFSQSMIVSKQPPLRHVMNTVQSRQAPHIVFRKMFPTSWSHEKHRNHITLW